MGNENST